MRPGACRRVCPSACQLHQRAERIDIEAIEQSCESYETRVLCAQASESLDEQPFEPVGERKRGIVHDGGQCDGTPWEPVAEFDDPIETSPVNPWNHGSHDEPDIIVVQWNDVD